MSENTERHLFEIRQRREQAIREELQQRDNIPCSDVISLAERLFGRNVAECIKMNDGEAVSATDAVGLILSAIKENDDDIIKDTAESDSAAGVGC